MFDTKHLKEIRKKMGYTQAYMAKKLGYASKTGYCELENGNVDISLERARAISNLFGMQVDEIFLPAESK